MNGYSNSSRPRKVGMVLIDPEPARAWRAIARRYNTDTLRGSYQVPSAGWGAGAVRARRFSRKGPAIESISCNAEIDATDFIGATGPERECRAFAVALELDATEGLVKLPSSELTPLNVLSRSSALEILPFEAHNCRVKGCNPFSFKLTAPPLPGAKKTNNTGDEK